LANEILTSIALDLESIKNGLNKAAIASEKGGKKAGKKFGKEFEKRSSKLISGISRRFLVLGATIGAAFGGRAILQAAAKQEDAVNKLNTALRNAGSFSEGASQNLQQFATDLQSITTVGDETALEMLSLAKAMGATNDQAKDLVKAAANLSAATGLTLESAVKNLGKTFGGLTGELGESVPQLRALSKETLMAGGAIDLINKRFAGAAAAQVKTFSGRMSQLSNRFGDLLEQLGFLVTRSPTIQKFIGFISDAFANLTNKVSDFGKTGDVIGDITKKLVGIAVTITQFAGPTIELFVNGVVNGFNTIRFGALKLLSFFKEEFKADAEAAFQDLQKSSEKIFDFSGTAQAEKFLTELQTFIETVDPIARETGNRLAASVAQPIKDRTIEATQFFTEAWNQAFSEVALTSKEFQKGLQQKLTGAFLAFRNGVAGSFSSIGAALVKGENAFAAFGKTILGLFGDLAMQMGQFYFLLGLGNLFLNPAAAAQQIAAGIGLQILGGALKALAGGGGAAPAGGNVGGGVAAGGGGLEAPVQELGQDLGEPEAVDSTRVTVNVAGNVLDRRETGLELAEVINEAFGSDGVVIAQAEA